MAVLGDDPTSDYPTSIDTVKTWENATVTIPSSSKRWDADAASGYGDAVRRIQLELGVNPAGDQVDVVTRLLGINHVNAANVGVGIIPGSALNKLHVQGDADADGLRVTSSTGRAFIYLQTNTDTQDSEMTFLNAAGTPEFFMQCEADTNIMRLSHNIAGGVVRIQGGSQADGLSIDDSATATHTRLLVYDVDNAQLERVTVGATDSGGVGFKVLRIPN